MEVELDGKVEDDLQVEEGQLLTKLGHALGEQVGHLIQVAYERVEGGLLEQETQRSTRVWLEGGLLEQEIQQSTRVWLEGEEGLSLQVELEDVDCCEREEGEEQNVRLQGEMLCVVVDGPGKQGEKRFVVVDGRGKQEEVKRRDEQEKLYVVVDGRGKQEERLWEVKLTLQVVVVGVAGEVCFWMV